MIKERKIKYSDSKFKSYLGLNSVAHKFIQNTGGFVTDFTKYNISEKDYLEFHIVKNISSKNIKVVKNISSKNIKVVVRYSGMFVCEFTFDDSEWLGYRDSGIKDKKDSRIIKLVPINIDKNLIRSLNRYVNEILSYKPVDGTSTLDIIINPNQIMVSKRDEYGNFIENSKTEFYIDRMSKTLYKRK